MATVNRIGLEVEYHVLFSGVNNVCNSECF